MEKSVSHPGRILRDLFMWPLGLTATSLSLKLNVLPSRVYEILSGERMVTADTALRLSRLFDTTPQYWLRLQAEYDLGQVSAQIEDGIGREVQPLKSSLNCNGNIVTGAEPGAAPRAEPGIEQSSTEPVLQLDANERRVYDAVTESPICFDELHDTLGMVVGELSAQLAMLELSDLIRRLPGDSYCKIPVSSSNARCVIRSAA